MNDKLVTIRQFIKKNLSTTALVAVTLILLITIPIMISLSNKEDSKRNTYAAQPTPAQTLIGPVVFRDSSTKTILSIQLAKNQQDAGEFDFLIPDKGNYSGTISLLFSGNQIIHPQGDITARFYPISGGKSIEIKIKMEGEINTESNSANINIWIGNIKYHLQTETANVETVVPVVHKTLDSFQSKNWTALYSQLPEDVQAKVTTDQITQLLANEPNIIATSLNGQAQIKYSGGYAYAMQPIALKIQQPDGSIKNYTANLYFVFDNGSWHFLSSDTPVVQ